MSKTLEFIRAWWIKAQLKAPPLAQRTVIPRLHEAKEIGRLLVKPYLPVYQLQGQGQGGPLTVTYVGLEFAKPFLMSLLFVEKPAEQRVGRIPFWRCNELTDLSSSDIIVVEATKHLIHRLPRKNVATLPQFIHHIVDVRGDWQAVRSRFRETVRKNELRWIRKYGYEYDLSYDDRDFETFYRGMYLPTMGERHGQLSSPMSIDEAYQHFRQGWLFRVNQDGDWVSGVMCQPQQNTLIARILGVKNADTRLIHEGAIAATYYAALHWANQHGYSAVNFLGTDPYLATGLFQQKRKWGASVSVPPYLHRQIWIKVNRNTPAVSQFLRETPLVIVDEIGKLYGLIIVDDLRSVSAETKQEWEARFATPGLSGLIVRSISSVVEGPCNGNDPGLVIPIP